MEKLFLLAIFSVVLFGCIGPSTQPPDTVPDQNTPDSNAFDALKDLNGFLAGGKRISIDLDLNVVTLNFEYDLNIDRQDVNLLTEVCSTACDVIDGNNWSLKKDLNFNSFNCYCTREFCRDEVQPDKIIRFCSDRTVGFAIRGQN